MRKWLLMVMAAPLLAQDPVMPLSLRKALDIALAPEGNARVEIARELVAQAEARRQAARAAFLPNVDGAVSYQDVTRNLRAFGIQFPTIPGSAFSSFVGPFAIFDARATASQSILDFASIGRYRATRAVVDTARREEDVARQQVTDQVARAYLAALRAEASVETAKANVELAIALRELADNQRRAGTGIGIDVTRAEVQMSNERQRLQVAENERNRAVFNLLRAMDLRLETKVELTDRLAHQPVEAVSFDQAMKDAIDKRPDLRAQRQREEATRLQSRAVSYEQLPSVGAFADYGAIGGSINDSRATRSVGIQVKVPVFDGGRRQARRTESASQWRQEQVRSRDLGQQAELEIRIAFDNLRSAELQVKTAEEGLEQSRKELEQAQRRYRGGVANSVEVTDAQTRLARAQDNRVAALFQHNLARLDLGTSMGTVERFLPVGR